MKYFFLISFLPAIAYWYLEEHYPLRIAVLGGLILACLEMLAEKIFTQHIHTLSKFNFYLILLLGGMSLMGDEGVWFKLQPAGTGMGIGAFLAIRCYQGKGILQEMIDTLGKESPPEFLIRSLEKHMAFFFFCYGSFMLYVATMLTTDTWLFFKTAGFYLIFICFFLFELIYMRYLLRKWQKQHLQRQILSQMKHK